MKKALIALIPFGLVASIIVSNKMMNAGEKAYVDGPTWVSEHLEEYGNLDMVTGFKMMDDPKAEYSGPIHQVAELPEYFNWYDYVEPTPVKNQGSCGSCVPFAYAGALEIMHRIVYADYVGTDGKLIDLAEQTLVSRCSPAGDCGGGYFTHGNYLRDKGLPFEKDDPYTARNSSCKESTKRVKIAKYVMIGESGREPTIQELKAAIHTYGPIVVTVNADSNWSRYKGGLYNACSSWGGNHMVVLYGWDDREGTGHWLLRNSWGQKWGENGGNMRTAYTGSNGRKCNAVARQAAYMVLPGMEDIRTFTGGVPSAPVIMGESD